jgi:hypothetical protein
MAGKIKAAKKPIEQCEHKHRERMNRRDIYRCRNFIGN